jgi:RimJ/RimL family protein N-acetyltransferase
MKILETERLALRELIADDNGFILKLLNEPGFIQNIGDRGVRSLDEARVYILNGPVASYERYGFGLYLVALKETSELVGICGLVKREALEDVDLGYAFLELYWGKGYAFESAQAVKTYAREALGLKRLVAVVNPDNEKSIRVLEKLGMRFEKMVKLSEAGAEIKLFAINLGNQSTI